MGLLSEGTPLEWGDSQQFVEYVKKHGIIQFLNSYNRLKDRHRPKFLWGDEVEYIICRLVPGSKAAQVSLSSAKLMERIKAKQLAKDENFADGNFLPEYGRFMIEATPGRPYGGFTSDLRNVEYCMRKRRELLQSLLDPNEYLLAISNFPCLGVGNFTDPPAEPNGPIAESKFIPDCVINPHPRFGCLTRNIRLRRGSKVDIRIPLFIDEKTSEKTLPKEEQNIHMDAMAFGMGCCCLQVTFQACNILEARHLYDQLVVMGPIMLALSASTPFHRGRIADTDVRWSTIAQSVDDRTPGERGEQPLKDGEKRIFKSRYDSVSSFLSLNPLFKEKYNDVPMAINDEVYETLKKEGIDDLLAKHVAHLFVRDPLVIYEELVELDDEKSTNHFENIQSTNWQTCRFKPPPEDSEIGWRVEFRSMEIQITDFENAAFTVFIALLSRAILIFDLNLYIPLSKIDENMEIAHRRDACRKEKFFFRSALKECYGDDEYSAYSMDEIINGRDNGPGLIKIVSSYLDVIECDEETRKVVDSYLDLISQRASGELLTTAQWLRTFVSLHPKYQKDSVITHEICKDILDSANQICKGDLMAPQLLGEFSGLRSLQSTSTSEDVPLYTRILDLFEDEECVKRYLGNYLAGNPKYKSRGAALRGKRILKLNCPKRAASSGALSQLAELGTGKKPKRRGSISGSKSLGNLWGTVEEECKSP
eukprot:178927_1